ncbi:hypothetical protein [Leucobacter salsicius]|uniref:hypothetical protein n=1 Tax=Leucobacter salsicius TaxID=664638 RepID=UPI0012F850DA|nr:hypothetical protein [Leucobacter salsicius]
MRSSYTNYGGAPEGQALSLIATRDFLSRSGFGDGPLRQARKGLASAHRKPFAFEAIGANYCDFCFSKLMGGEFDRLEDGRERCVRCSRSVVRTKEEFVELFTTTRRLLELAFDINIEVSMNVHMVNAREIARRTGESFEPTPGVDARVLGFAERSDAGYSLHIENGAPALAAVSTIAHELTHIWQFSQWHPEMIKTRYGADKRLLIFEGMASWAQIQYLLCIKEFEFADRQEAYVEQRTDEYGVGFRLFREHYPLNRNGLAGRRTPFQREHPL